MTATKAAGPAAGLAMFRDATETLFALAEARGRPAPSRHFVADADEAHALALDGPVPIVAMSLDDVLECRQADHPAASGLVAFHGVHRGFLELVARPGIGGIGDLRGHRVAVDTDSGYARALYEILTRHGIRDQVEIVHAGATNLRYDKLVAGQFDATLLGAPFTLLARRQGYASLGTVIEALGGYQAIVLAAQADWLAAHPAAAAAVTDCLAETIAWGQANMAEAGMLLADAELAAVLFGPSGEFLADGRIDPADARVVVDLFNAATGNMVGYDAAIARPRG